MPRADSSIDHDMPRREKPDSQVGERLENDTLAFSQVTVVWEQWDILECIGLSRRREEGAWPGAIRRLDVMSDP